MVDEIKRTQPKESIAKQHFIPTASSLGSSHFKEIFGLRHAYVAGSMYRGISSPELVIRMAKANLLSFYGIGGLDLDEVESGIKKIQEELSNNESFGVNLLCNYIYPEEEFQCIELFLKYQIRIIEASSFLMITPAIAFFVIKGLYYDHAKGRVSTRHHLFAKVSRIEIAKIFMEPIPSHIIESLLLSGKISLEEAALAKTIPISTYICVEGDSGGHTDRKLLAPLLISILNLRNEMKKIYQNRYSFFIGAGGGLGEPISISTNFLMGADFILTGSINQCSVEARMSGRAKDLLQNMHSVDTEYAIAGDMFEMGAKVQVLKKGTLFPTRANTLYHIYHLFKDVADLPSAMREMIEKHFFRLTFQEVAEDLGDYYQQKKTPKEKMAALFRWYLKKSNEWALLGVADRVADFQIHTGPALGMFNQWMKGTEYENWQNRHVDEIGELLMEGSLKCIKKFPNFSH